MPQKKHYLAYIDVLTAIAGMAVVILHLNYCVWAGPDNPAWVSAITIETFFFWPVPVFFMITGTTLMDYRNRMDTNEFYRRRFRRTVVPWLVWSLIGLAFACFSAQVFGTMPMPALGPRSIFNGIATSAYVEYYWFFPALFAMYLSLPLLSSVSHRDEVFISLISLGILFNGIMPLLHDLFNVDAMGAFAPPAVSGYTVYVLIGYQLSHWNPTRTQRLGIYAAGIVGWLCQLFGTMAVSTGSTVSMVFKSAFSPFAVAQAVAVYVLVRQADWDALFARMPRLGKSIQVLSSLTFGIYLMQWFLLKTVAFTLNPPATSMLWRLGGAFAIYTLCAEISYLFKRLPLLKHIVP